MLPGVPQQRTIEGPAGTSINEIRQFLVAIKNLKLLSGKEVIATYTSSEVAASTVKRIITGLEYTPTGYFVINGHKSSNVVQESTPASETDNTVLYLRATVAGTYTFWVF